MASTNVFEELKVDIGNQTHNHRLLAAVNDAAMAVRNGWIFFVGMMAFFFIAVAGVTHQDLLLNSPVKLPLIQIDIELTRFFQFAPLAVVLFHFGILLQYIMLAGKTLALHEILKTEEEKTGNRTHPIRLEMSSYFFVQAMAGPARSPVLSIFLRAMTVLTLGLLPLTLLIYFQTTYLAFHDPVVTWAHRLYVLADLFVLLIIGVFTRFPNKLFRQAFSSYIRYHSSGIFLTLLISLAALFYSFCIATIPDSWLDRKMTALSRGTPLHVSVPYGTVGTMQNRHAFLPTAWLFEGRVSEMSGRASSWFSRNLIVTDVDLVPYVNAEREKANEVSLHLRGRDLRYANFSQSDMHRADFKEANLKQANLSQTNLSFARLRGARMYKVDLRNADLSHADLRWAKLKKSDLRQATLVRANLSSANLETVNLTDANLEGSKLQWANLLGANMEKVNLRKATISQANLQSVNLNGAEMQGADLFKANLNGAVLRNAHMQQAILLWARMVAADLRGAKLQGSDLRSTNMALSDLRGADLQGVDLVSATLKDADLRNVSVWQTNPTSDDMAQELRMQNIKLKNPEELGKKNEDYGLSRKKTPQEKRREANVKRLKKLQKLKKTTDWDETDEYSIWEGLMENKTGSSIGKYSLVLSDRLAEQGCRDRSRNAWMLASIIKRATDVYHSTRHSDNTSYFPPFNGNIERLYQKIADKRCQATKNLRGGLLVKLRIAVVQYRKKIRESKGQ